MTEQVTHLNTAIVEKFLYALRDKDFDTIIATGGVATGLYFGLRSEYEGSTGFTAVSTFSEAARVASFGRSATACFFTPRMAEASLAGEGLGSRLVVRSTSACSIAMARV